MLQAQCSMCRKTIFHDSSVMQHIEPYLIGDGKTVQLLAANSLYIDLFVTDI